MKPAEDNLLPSMFYEHCGFSTQLLGLLQLPVLIASHNRLSLFTLAD